MKKIVIINKRIIENESNSCNKFWKPGSPSYC